jgi:hypothetical protein
MAAEQHPLPGAPAGSSWTTFFYVNHKDPTDMQMDLAKGWVSLPINSDGPGSYVVGGPGTHGACPTLRWISNSNSNSSLDIQQHHRDQHPQQHQGPHLDSHAAISSTSTSSTSSTSSSTASTSQEPVGYWYLISGGLSVYLDRSINLSHWTPASATNKTGIMLQATPADARVCTEYIGYDTRITTAEQKLLAHISNSSQSFDTDVSDVDLWELPDGTTLFCYLFGNQNNEIFSALGRYHGTMADWFRAQYSVE